jgi:hypothetical protein
VINLVSDCENVKQALGTCPFVELEFDAVAGNDDRSITVASDDLITVGGRFNETVTGLIKRAVAQAGGGQVDSVQMFGAASRLEFVQQIGKKGFNMSALRWSVN